MSKLRSINTSFWSDPFIEELAPDEKLLFLYLITNEKTNMLGIYENSVRKISFETGIGMERVETILKRFETLRKVKVMDNWVMLVNFMKHQNYNTNMKKSAIECYFNLPENLKIKGLKLSKDNPSESFETLSKAYGMVRKVEVEVEYEKEDEVESPVGEENDTTPLPGLNEGVVDAGSLPMKKKNIKSDIVPAAEIEKWYDESETNEMEFYRSVGRPEIPRDKMRFLFKEQLFIHQLKGTCDKYKGGAVLGFIAADIKKLPKEVVEVKSSMPKFGPKIPQKK